MKLRASAILLLAALSGLAQHPNATRLESVTWNGDGCVLTWEVSEGTIGQNGEYQAETRKSYQIDLHKATMRTGGEKRGFDKQEATQVHRLVIEVLGRYAMESTVWWEEGHGERLQNQVRGTPPAPVYDRVHATRSLRASARLQPRRGGL